jgi:GrpB-like predicted nucleotidyltransferase (UPF0157 family)
MRQEEADPPVRIVPYDPGWPALFEKERALLESCLARWLAGPIEHVGSTAVPGLAAKPVIDIMAAVESLTAFRPAISVLADSGYAYFPYHPEQEHWFCKPSAAFRTHHLHLVPLASRWWNERLAFRDYLRRDCVTAEEYAELKRQLARHYEFDREAYTEAKGPFIQQILKLALSDGPQETS